MGETVDTTTTKGRTTAAADRREPLMKMRLYSGFYTEHRAKAQPDRGVDEDGRGGRRVGGGDSGGGVGARSPVVEYKPGWAFSWPSEPESSWPWYAGTTGDGIPVLASLSGSVLFNAVNTYHPESRAQLTLPVRRGSQREVIDRMMCAILLIEIHEAMEAFRVDGRRPFDPHNPAFPGAHLEHVLKQTILDTLHLPSMY